MKIKLTISQRLVLGFGTITLLVLIALTSIFFTINRSAKIANNNLNFISPSTEGINQLFVMVNETKMLTKNWIFVEKHSNTPDKLRLKTIHEKEFPELKKNLAVLSKNWSKEEIQIFNSVIKSVEDSLFLYQEQVMTALSTFESYEDPMIVFEIFPMVEVDGLITTVTTSILERISSLSKTISEKQDQGNNSLVRSFVAFRVFIVVIGIILVLVAAFSSFFTTRRIIGPINRLKSDLLRKSKGDFTEDDIELTHDEIGEMTQALGEMSGNIRKIVEEIQNGAEILTTSSQSINNSARSIADGASMQASSAEEVSASMEEMTSSTSQNAENAQQAESIAKLVANDVGEIVKSVSDTSKAMKNITEKISIINDIAERIDLLAINAAIEAARAGEHGKGFAVVASEVRNLAESSQIAANEIDKVSQASVEVAETSNKLLEGIIPHINGTLKRVQEINAASTEQDTGINQVNNAIQQLSGIIQQNVAAAEELSASSDELLHQSDRLIKGISFFKIHEDDSDSESTEEIEQQIELLKDMLLKKKNKRKEKEEPKLYETEDEPEKKSNKKLKNNLKEKLKKAESKVKGINIFLDDKKDKEFENF